MLQNVTALDIAKSPVCQVPCSGDVAISSQLITPSLTLPFQAGWKYESGPETHRASVWVVCSGLQEIIPFPKIDSPQSYTLDL